MESAESPEHAVLVFLKLSNEKFGTDDERSAIQELSEDLESAIADRGVGEFDGDEFGEGGCTLFMYGPDADALFNSISSILFASPLTNGAHVIKRYGSAGDPDAREVRINLDEANG